MFVTGNLQFFINNFSLIVHKLAQIEQAARDRQDRSEGRISDGLGKVQSRLKEAARSGLKQFVRNGLKQPAMNELKQPVRSGLKQLVLTPPKPGHARFTQPSRTLS